MALIATLLAASCGSSASTATPNPRTVPTPPGCAPTPCATAAGLTVYVAVLAPSFLPSAVAGATLDPSTHLVLVQLQATARATTLLPITAFHLRDPQGRLLSVDTIEGGEECEAIGAGIAAVPQTRAAPTSACFDIGGATFSGFSVIVDVPSGGQLSIPLPA